MTAFFGIYEKTQQISSYVKFPTLHVHHATKNVFIKLTMLLPSYFIHSVSRKASASMYCCAHLTLILICQKDMYDTHFIRYDAFVLFSRQTQLSSALNCFNAMKRYTANFSWYIIIFFLFLMKANVQLIQFDLFECVVHHTAAAPLKIKVVKGMDNFC